LNGSSFVGKSKGHFGNTIASQIGLPTFANFSFDDLQYYKDSSQSSVHANLSLCSAKASTAI